MGYLLHGTLASLKKEGNFDTGDNIGETQSSNAKGSKPDATWQIRDDSTSGILELPNSKTERTVVTEGGC